MFCLWEMIPDLWGATNNPQPMKPYMIIGPESLILAAHAEVKAVLGESYVPNIPPGPYVRLFLPCNIQAYFLSGKTGISCTSYYDHLTLPADWDKLMGILAELKKPKLPEYAQHKITGQVVKVIDEKNVSYNYYDIYGGKSASMGNYFDPITEQDFINGGLKELAEAGYVKGAQFEWGLKTPFNISAVSFQKDGVVSDSVTREITRKGFCFTISGSKFTLPVGVCTLIPTLPTTSKGIPYYVNDSIAYIGEKACPTVLTLGILRRLISQGVIEVVTKDGSLTRADLELLTK